MVLTKISGTSTVIELLLPMSGPVARSDVRLPGTLGRLWGRSLGPAKHSIGNYFARLKGLALQWLKEVLMYYLSKGVTNIVQKTIAN